MAERIVLNKGTIEHIIVDVADRLKNLTDLAGANTAYDVRAVGADTWISEGLAASVVGMSAYCLIDTTLANYVAGNYELFVKFSNLPESPRLGPFTFEVNA